MTDGQTHPEPHKKPFRRAARQPRSLTFFRRLPTPRYARNAIFLILLSTALLVSRSSLADGTVPYGDDWWNDHYAKIQDTENCRNLKDTFDQARQLDRRVGKMSSLVLLGFLYWQGQCFDKNLLLAEQLLTRTAERGESVAAVYLAQFYYLIKGEDAPETKAWVERAKYAMALLGNDWKQGLYTPLSNYFKQTGQHLAPQLEQAFSWYEGIQKGDPEVIYQTGIRLLENDTYPESKVLACEWLFEAETKGHVKARFQLGRQLALGDGVKVAPGKALLLLELSANVDKNADAYLLAAQLLQQGDVYEKHLPNAYFALLKAQSMGRDVSEQLKQLEPQITEKERERAQSWADFESSQLSLSRDSPQFSQPSCTYSSR